MTTLPVVGDTVLNFVNGSWREPDSGRWTQRYDPADRNVLVAQAPDSTRVDAAAAIESAFDGQDAWSATPPPVRGRLLMNWLGWIDGHRSELATLLTREEGKTLDESLGEVTRARDILEYTAGMGRRLTGSVLPSDDADVFCYSSPQPLGVVGLISPWNFPVAIPVWKMAPALIAGNTVVLKPSPLTPLTATALVHGLEAAGVPKGVVNLIHGDSEPGIELTSNPKVKGLSFTGSTKVGSVVARAASERFLKVQLELGGKNPQIVLDDADLELAVAGVVAGAFGSTGQRCTATSRAIVTSPNYDKFLAAVIDRASKMRVGPGVERGVEMGPLVDGKALESVARFSESARAEGARFHIGGQRLSGSAYDRGFFFSPTVVEATPEMAVAKEEVFGPVLSVIRARDLDDALTIANSVRYGLTASIFTRDLSRCFQFASRVQAGIVHVNRPGVGGYSHAPFGGIKDSGYGGREVGNEVLNFYTETKMVYINHGS